MGYYFVKDNFVHKYPPKCETKREGEKLYGTPPDNYIKCKKCFNLPLKPDPMSK